MKIGSSNRENEILASILASENVSFSYDAKAHTAVFNVMTRHITLPLFSASAPNYLIDHFIVHEVGHAVYTPVDFLNFLKPICEQYDAHENYIKSAFNILEDIRVDTLMSRKYPGLHLLRSRGYNYLYLNNFFKLGDPKDIESFSFLDRLNIHYKIGAIIDVPFSQVERRMAQEFSLAETPEQIYKNIREILDFHIRIDSENKPSDLEGDEYENFPLPLDVDKRNNKVSGPDVTTGTSASSAIPVSMQINSTPDFDDPEDEIAVDPEVYDPDGDDHDYDDYDDYDDDDQYEYNANEEPIYGERSPDWSSIKSIDAFARGILNFVGSDDSDLNPPETIRIESRDYGIPILEFEDSNIVPNWAKRNQITLGEVELNRLAECRKFASNASNIFLAKMKADQITRTRVHRTGVINMARLHEYRTSENIFLNKETTPSGKSHGVVVLVDFSQSMQGNFFFSLVTQIINFSYFCDRVGIPYEIHTFSNGTYDGWQSSDSKVVDGVLVQVNSENNDTTVLLPRLKSQIRILSSDMSPKKRQRVIDLLVTAKLQLVGSTPLSSLMLNSMKFMEDFKKKNSVQYLHTIVMTDGADNRSMYNLFAKPTAFLNTNFSGLVISSNTLSLRKYLTRRESMSSVGIVAHAMKKISSGGMSYVEFTGRIQTHNSIDGSPIMKEVGEDGKVKSRRNGNVTKYDNVIGFDAGYQYAVEAKIDIDDVIQKMDGEKNAKNLNKIRKLIHKKNNSDGLFIYQIASAIAEGGY